MKIHVRLNGIMSSRSSWCEKEFILDEGATLSNLKQRIEAESDSLHFDAVRAAIAINNKVVSKNQQLHDGDSVTILPPLAGG